MKAGCIGGGFAVVLLILSYVVTPGFRLDDSALSSSARHQVAASNLRKPAAGKPLRPNASNHQSAPDPNDSYFWVESQPTHNGVPAPQKPQRILHRA